MASPYTKAESPQKEWPKSIHVLRQRLHIGRRLRYSAMAVSRWERGELEPTNRAHIEPGTSLTTQISVFLGTRRTP